MPYPVRILQVVFQMNRAGLETMLMNYYRNIDREKIQFDFLMCHEGDFDYDTEIRAMGGKIYHIPSITIKKGISSWKALRKFFAMHQEYKIVHCHLDAFSAFVLRAAKKANVPIRIAHSHNNGFPLDKKLLLRYIAKSFIPIYATDFWGCSQSALQFMFGKRVAINTNLWILPNAIDIKKFTYCPEIRLQKRASLKVSNKFVVGHIGRLCPQKNQVFLLDIFHELHHIYPQSILMLIGTGQDERQLKEKVLKLGLESKVLFLGVQENIPDLLQAMDVFIFPSRFEGFGIALLEAEAVGLPCIASDTIAPEANVNGKVLFLSLRQHAKIWARTALIYKDKQNRKVINIEESDYEIGKASALLQQKYLHLWGNSV